MARIALVTLVGALAASILGCGGREGAPPSALVVFERSGGIAGFDDRLVVQDDGQARLQTTAGEGTPESFRVSAEGMARLDSLLHQIDLDALESGYESHNVIDEIHYRIVYGGRTMDADRTVLPDQLRPLVHFLSEVTLANRAPHPAESRRGGDFSPVVYPSPVKPERRGGAVRACPNPRGVQPLGPGARAASLRALRRFNGDFEHDKHYADRVFWPDLRRNKHLDPFAPMARFNGHPVPTGVRGSSGPSPPYTGPPGAPCSAKVVRRTWAITLGPARGALRNSASLPMTYYLLRRQGHWLVWYWY